MCTKINSASERLPRGLSPHRKGKTHQKFPNTNEKYESNATILFQVQNSTLRFFSFMFWSLNYPGQQMKYIIVDVCHNSEYLVQNLAHNFPKNWKAPSSIKEFHFCSSKSYIRQ